MEGPSAHRFLFYSKELEPSSRSIELEGDERHHLSRVLRMGVGETVYATNGRGSLARCRIEESTRKAARLSVLEVEESGLPERPVTLALALLRKDAFERAVEQCTELGISSLVPFVSRKSHVQSYSEEFLVRLRRIALAAMKQSFRTFLPEVEIVADFDDVVALARGAGFAMVGDSGGDSVRGALPPGPLVIVVGPEGGFADEERVRLREAGVRPVRASENRLRSETAAACLVALALSAAESRESHAVD